MSSQPIPTPQPCPRCGNIPCQCDGIPDGAYDLSKGNATASTTPKDEPPQICSRCNKAKSACICPQNATTAASAGVSRGHMQPSCESCRTRKKGDEKYRTIFVKGEDGKVKPTCVSCGSSLNYEWASDTGDAIIVWGFDGESGNIEL
jgi:hypothetical protein